ncbi:MAG: hypothetical protein HY319_31385 [Armatimonadetes bacterium]|nr:hypothetical protein [Armatimonadota bacterium]
MPGIELRPVVAAICFLCLALAGPIGRLLGPEGIDVIGRLLALVLCAIAVEFIASGLAGIFPALSISPSVE